MVGLGVVVSKEVEDAPAPVVVVDRAEALEVSKAEAVARAAVAVEEVVAAVANTDSPKPAAS